MSGTDTTSESFFEAKYRQDRDPWKFASSAYEQGRYDAIVQALGNRRYERAFEPGCSIGVLTLRLAACCDEVNAIDISATAVEQARERCKELKNVGILRGELPNAIPVGSFDLVVFSEIGYYFEEQQLLDLTKCLVGRIRFSGTFLAAHWLGNAEDHLLSGDRVHEILMSLGGLAHEYAERQECFRIDRWARV